MFIRPLSHKLRPILQKLNRRSVLDKLFLKMILSTSRKRGRQAKSYYISFREDGKKPKMQMVIKIEFTPLSDGKIVPFTKGF